jgi:hypothetical protein
LPKNESPTPKKRKKIVWLEYITKYPEKRKNISKRKGVNLPKKSDSGESIIPEATTQKKVKLER